MLRVVLIKRGRKKHYAREGQDKTLCGKIVLMDSPEPFKSTVTSAYSDCWACDYKSRKEVPSENR